MGFAISLLSYVAGTGGVLCLATATLLFGSAPTQPSLAMCTLPYCRYANGDDRPCNPTCDRKCCKAGTAAKACQNVSTPVIYCMCEDVGFQCEPYVPE